MQGPDTHVLPLAASSGLWRVETSDAAAYLVDADQPAAVMALTPEGLGELSARGWLDLVHVRQPADNTEGVFTVGAVHTLHLRDDADGSEALVEQAAVTSIERARPDRTEVGSAVLRRRPATSSRNGRPGLLIDDAVGVWAVHGSADTRPVYLDLDARGILSARSDGTADTWLALRKVRGTGGRRDAVQVGSPVTFTAIGLPHGKTTLTSVTRMRRLNADEVAALPPRLPPRRVDGEAGSGHVRLPVGEHVVLEVADGDPVVFDQAVADAAFNMGLHLRSRRAAQQRGKTRLVVDGSAQFLVGGRDLGAKKGLRVLHEGLMWMVEQASTAHAADTGEADRRAVHVDEHEAGERLEELLDRARDGRRIVVTRAGAPAAALVSWAHWCALNADLSWNESAYWSAWEGGAFDADRYAELVAPTPHSGTPRRRWQR